MSISHKSLPESELHESKGVSTAVANKVYVTDGLGSGTFQDYSTEPAKFVGATAGQVLVSDGANSSTLQPYDKEPKGIAAAASGTVYTADGLGSGAWTAPAAAPTIAYGEMFIDNLSSANTITVATAADATLNTSTDYTKIVTTGMWQIGENYGITVDNTLGELTIITAGVYKIDFWTTHNIAATGSYVLGWKYAVNGVLSNQKVRDRDNGSGSVGTTAATGITATLAAGDKISLYMAATVGGVVTLSDAGIVITLLKA